MANKECLEYVVVPATSNMEVAVKAAINTVDDTHQLIVVSIGGQIIVLGVE